MVRLHLPFECATFIYTYASSLPLKCFIFSFLFSSCCYFFCVFTIVTVLSRREVDCVFFLLCVFCFFFSFPASICVTWILPCLFPPYTYFYVLLASHFRFVTRVVILSVWVCSTYSICMCAGDVHCTPYITA